MLPTHKILIIEPSRELQNELIQFLNDSKFIVEIAKTADEGIHKVIQHRFDVIICQQNLGDISGFKVYAKLEDALLKYNTAFFLLMENFESEDILIGLELGIDNFIIRPFEKQSILNKIDKLLKKRKEHNFIETRRFLEMFRITPGPKFIVENNRITLINDACENLLNLKKKNRDKSMFFEVFDIGGNNANKMNLRKLENGLVDHCELNNVKLLWDSNRTFSINAYNVNRGEGGKIFAEIVLENNVKGNYGVDDFCPQHGRCLKVTQKENAVILSNVILTARENEVFELSAQGFPIKQIAVQLVLSERTVEKHRSNIMEKTKTHSMIEALLVVQKQYTKPE